MSQLFMATVVALAAVAAERCTFYYIALDAVADIWDREHRITVDVDPPEARAEYWGLREAGHATCEQPALLCVKSVLRSLHTSH